MRTFVRLIAITAVFCLAATSSWAQLVDYTQDFEGLVADGADPGALAGDGWLVFGNDPDGQYGPFAAPSGGPGFSNVVTGQSGIPQGANVLVVYNDYNNPNHNDPGDIIEALVFQEQSIGADDAGKTCTFAWQHKKGDIQPDSTAAAFMKVLDPNSGFPTVANPVFDTTNLPVEWDGGQLQVTIDPAWLPGTTGPLGHILQFGYLTNAQEFTPSGNFYDNISFTCEAGDPQGVPMTGTTGMIVFFVLLGSAMAFVVARGTMRRATNA